MTQTASAATAAIAAAAASAAAASAQARPGEPGSAPDAQTVWYKTHGSFVDLTLLKGANASAIYADVRKLAGVDASAPYTDRFDVQQVSLYSLRHSTGTVVGMVQGIVQKRGMRFLEKT